MARLGDAVVADFGELLRRHGRESHQHQSAAGAPALGKDADGNLEHRIADRKTLFEPADLQLSESQFRHHRRCGDGDALLLQIGDESKTEHKAEDTPADSDAAGRIHVARGSALASSSPSMSWRKRRRNRSGAESIAISMFGECVVAKPCCTALRMTRSSSKALRTPSANRREACGSSGRTLRIW